MDYTQNIKRSMPDIEHLASLYIYKGMEAQEIADIYGLNVNSLMWEFRKSGISKGRNKSRKMKWRRDLAIRIYSEKLREYFSFGTLTV